MNRMKLRVLLGALLVCAAPVCAQPKPPFAPRLVTPQQAQLLAAPTLIDLDLHDVTLRAALDELQRQSGVTLSMGGENAQLLEAKLSLQLKTRSFGEAFAALAKAANVKAAWRRDSPNRRARVLWSQREIEAESDALLSSEGLFAVQLFWLETVESSTITLADSAVSARQTSGYSRVFIVPVPDLRLAFVTDPILHFTRAEDEKGRSLLPPVSPNSFQQPMRPYDDYTWNHWGPSYISTLSAPAPDARLLRRLEGVVTYALVSERQKWEVPDLLAAPQWKRRFRGPEGAFDVTIEAARTEAESSVLKLQIEIAPSHPSVAPPPYLTSGLPFFANLKIEDAVGNDLSPGYPAREVKDNKVTLRNTIKNRGAIKLPLKLTLDLPVDVVQTQVPFSFSDVPLP